jgi:6-phosphogluconolactonase (cycloisomerase 2 family)
MDPFKIAAARATILPLVLLFSACGGGGSPNPPNQPATFTVGGVASGLSGNSVALRLNGGADFLVTTNGSFTFPGTITSGTAYTITVQMQPSGPAQTCALTNASGTVTANVTNVSVNCTTNTYRVGGTLAGLGGGSVVLRNNGGGDLTLSANGTFQFTTAVASGGAYAVTVQTQPLGPSQTCVVSQGAGNVATADIVDVTVTCTTNIFSIGGTISGLIGTGLVLRNNGGNDLTVNANGSFTFSAPVASGNNYLVTVLTQPAPQQCTVANAGGTVLAANVTSVTVTCANLYSIGGTVNGLDVAGLVLRNSGGDDLTITANGTFSFATPVPPGTSYTVTAVDGTPASPRHVCQIVNGTGISPGADVTNVEVTCEADRFAYVAHFSPGWITALTANHETGALAPIAGTSGFATGDGAVSIVSDPRGRFVYVANANANTVSGYSVDAATGALTAVPGSPFAAGTLPRSLAIDSKGLFLYAANVNSDNVYGWAIQADGSLSAVPGSPYSTGFASGPVSVATSPASQCCYLYVAHSLGSPARLSAFAYDSQTGALTPIAGSPYSLPNAYTPSSVLADNTGEFVYMTASGTGNVTTFDVAGGTGGGVLTERPGSPSPLGSTPCEIQQPRLSSSLFVISGLSYQLLLVGEDPNTLLPIQLDRQTMFAGSYCSLATDPYGKFVYVPKVDADYLFGFSVSAGGSTLAPLPLNPLPPENTYTLPASEPRAMVLRYSRRDREMLQVP